MNFVGILNLPRRRLYELEGAEQHDDRATAGAALSINVTAFIQFRAE